MSIVSRREFLKYADPSLSMNLEHEVSTIYEAKCQQMVQYIDALIANIRNQSKQNDINVKTVLDLIQKLRNLSNNEVVRSLDQRHKNNYAVIVNLIQYGMEELTMRKMQLQEVENITIA